MKNKTNIYVRNNQGVPIHPEMIMGIGGHYASGNILDANATEKVVDERIASLIDSAPEALDTLKEIGQAIPTKTSDLTNDAGFITAEQAADTAVVSVTANQPFPSSWGSANNMSQLISAINNDATATKGKIYLSTVDLSDLPGGMLLAEMKVEIMEASGLGKNLLFTVNSEDVSPYKWEYVSAYGRTNQWRSYLPSTTTLFSGDYTDLTNKPTIPAAQVNADWNSSSGVSEILNKPTLSTVATSGSYNDLENKPTIPTVPSNVSAFTNDAGYTTNVGTITGIQMNGSTVASSGVADLGTVITAHQSLANYVTKTEFNQKMAELSEGMRWYGIKWTSANATPIRIGSNELHMTLPIQSKMKRCMVQDNGTVTGYISDTDYTKYTNGTTVDYTGGDGQFMVEIPEYYYDAFTYVDGGVSTYYLILYPTATAGKKSKKVYVSAVEACSNDADTDQATKKLFSICMADGTVTSGSMAASSITYDANAAKYRGGSSPTTPTNDANVNSELGRPVTNKTRASFRTYAANRGTGWSQQYWSAYMSFVRLYVVEYCNFNTLATYNSSLTAEGFKQGGLGEGFSNIDSTFWSNYNGYQPIAPCGVTKSLVNNTGIISLSFAADEMGSGVSAISFQIPSYRGIENPFGHIWKWTDGINVNTVSDITSVYTCENITNFADDTTSNYTMRAQFDKPSGGWIKTWNWDENGDFIPTSTGGSSASYLCDYSWWADGWRVVRSGGGAGSGSSCGLFCFDADDESSGAYASIGGRLYYTPAE